MFMNMDDYNEKDIHMYWISLSKDEPVKPLFLSYVSFDKETTCWNWKGYKSELNYGSISIDGRIFLSHRLSYTIFVEPIKKGLVIDHICHNRACCNPEHLRAVTIRENNSRNPHSRLGYAYGKTHCNNGHELSDDNLVRSSLKRGKKECLKCLRKKIKTEKFRKSITVDWISN